MAWELEDATTPAPAAAASPAQTGQWALDGAPAPNPADLNAPWYQRILGSLAAGAKHRLNATADTFGTVPIDNTPNADGSHLTIEQALAHGMTAHNAVTAAQDARDKAAGLGQGLAGGLAYGLGEAPETLLMPQLNILKGAGLLRAGANAAFGGAAQGAYSAAANDQSVASGAGLGAAGGVLGKSLGSVIAKGANALRGNWSDPGLQAANAAAGDLGVNLRVGDLAPESGFRQLEDYAKFVPGSGTNGALKEQAGAFGSAVQNLEQDARAPIARQLDSGATPEQLIVKGAQDMHDSHRAVARALYAAVPSDVTVKPDNFLPAVRSLATDYGDSLGKMDLPAPIRDKLGKMIDPGASTPALTAADQQALAFAGNSPGAGPLLEKLSPGIGQRIQAQAGGATPNAVPTLTSDEAHWMQSALGDIQRAADAKVARGDALGSFPKAVGDARSALLADMDSTAGVSQPFAAARDYYRDNVMPFRSNPLLRSLVEPGATGDGLFNKLGKDSVEGAKQLMAGLTPEGQAALQYGYIARGANKAASGNLVSGVSTQQAKKAFDIGDAMGSNRQMAQILTPAQQQSADAVREVAQRIGRAAQWNVNPHTGAHNLLPNLAKGALAAGVGHAAGLGALPAIAAPILSARAVTALSRSPAFKNLYFAGSDNAASPLLQALAAQGAAGRSPSILDYLGR